MYFKIICSVGLSCWLLSAAALQIRIANLSGLPLECQISIGLGLPGQNLQPIVIANVIQSDFILRIDIPMNSAQQQNEPFNHIMFNCSQQFRQHFLVIGANDPFFLVTPWLGWLLPISPPSGGLPLNISMPPGEGFIAQFKVLGADNSCLPDQLIMRYEVLSVQNPNPPPMGFSTHQKVF